MRNDRSRMAELELQRSRLKVNVSLLQQKLAEVDAEISALLRGKPVCPKPSPRTRRTGNVISISRHASFGQRVR